MTRILIHTLGSSGDSNPAVALAAVLRGRGHQVTFAVSPAFADNDIAAWVARLGQRMREEPGAALGADWVERALSAPDFCRSWVFFWLSQRVPTWL